MSPTILRAGALTAFAWLALQGAALAAERRQFVTGDGVRLSYLEAGPADARTVIFVPGWTMPAWIFDAQIAALQDRWHVVALDLRGQGESDRPAYGYAAARRGRDISELIPAVTSGRVVVVGWSLGVLDTLSMLAADGDSRVAGLVLIDNSIGEPPAPAGRGPSRPATVAPTEAQRTERRAAFVNGMFAHDPGADYRARLTADSLRMGPDREQALLAYDVPRERWRDALHATDRPVLYVIRPRWTAQGEALATTRPNARVAVFEHAGHALFVDEPDRFNALLSDFLDHADWGPSA